MIKFIYFDVGGVVIKDFSGTNKWAEFMKGVGIKFSDFEKFEKFWEGLNVSIADDMEHIIPLLNSEFKLNLPANYDLLSDFTKRFEKNESIWPVLEKAKERYKIGLLTDQYPRMLDDIYKKGLMPNIEFDVVLDSSKEKLKKPYKEVYMLAEKLCGFSGSDILFVDNSQKNLDVPKKLSWKTYFYNSSDVVKSSEELAKLI